MIDLSDLLDRSREVKETDQGFDLTCIKEAAARLPNFIQGDKVATDLLDVLFAILFHVQFPMRKYVAESWYDTHEYIPSGTKRETNETNVTSPELQMVLSRLIKPQAPLVRRKL